VVTAALPVLVTISAVAYVAVTHKAPLDSSVFETKENLSSNAEAHAQSPSIASPTPLHAAETPEAKTPRVSNPRPIAFLEGYEIEVALRPPVEEQIIVKSFAEDYDRLAQMAKEGSGTAAYVLYEGLRDCKDFIFDTDAEVESAVQDLYQTRRLPSDVEDSSFPPISNEDLIPAEKMLRDIAAQCMGLVDEQRSESDAWLATAVELEHIPAMLWSAQLAESKNERVSLYERAFNLGDINSAGHLAVLYGRSKSSDIEDQELSYAYLYLYAHLNEMAFEDWLDVGSGHAEASVKAANDLLAEKEAMLHDHEREAAVQLAESILTAAGTRCCFDKPDIRRTASMSR
jgi:hypothetical protein